MTKRTKNFDKTYFDKWYRSRKHKIGTRADLERQIHLGVAAAELVLMRPIRSVLDVGAGEGRWHPIIKEIRPRAKYYGIDPSEYTVSRFGKERNIVQGGITDITRLFKRKKFDLVVCWGVLNYLPPATVQEGLKQIASVLEGVAFLEIYTDKDEVEGDTRDWYTHPASQYLKMAKKAGLSHCGLNCYIPKDREGDMMLLELGR
jgi:SAM-dependent methyltransferase